MQIDKLLDRRSEIMQNLIEAEESYEAYRKEALEKKKELDKTKEDLKELELVIGLGLKNAGSKKYKWKNTFVSPKKLPPVLISKVDTAPDEYIKETTKIVKSIDKRKILDDLKHGVLIDGYDIDDSRYSIKFDNII
jgi:hypothetical protein